MINIFHSCDNNFS